MTSCPGCDAAWQPADVRGVLYFQHSPACRYERPEMQTQDADLERERALSTWRGFHRQATDTERELLTHLGYEPAAGSPYIEEDPGTLVHVRWIGSIRRRTFPGLRPADPTAGLPDPDPAWPKRRAEPPPEPAVRPRRPAAW